MAPVDVTMISTSLTVYTLLYICVCFCFVIRTKEFESSGLYVENLFDKFLPVESVNFILFHIHRSSLTLLVHSALPLVYFMGLLLFSEEESLFQHEGLWWNTYYVLLIYFSFIFPLVIGLAIFYWSRNKCSNHHIVKKLEKFCNSDTNWLTLASEINTEYRRLDKVSIQTCSTIRVIVTENWIIKVSPYTLDLARQSDAVLKARGTDTHTVSAEGQGTVQYINLEVKITRPNVQPFSIRFNSMDFSYLQSKIQRPIDLQNITFYQSRIDRFLDVFSLTIKENPTYVMPNEEDVDTCIGCMQFKADVKLYKCCGSSECAKCNCRPLWCISCMGKWFASRQDQDRPETWLQSKCTCPVCRSVFCILDVCALTYSDSGDEEEDPESEDYQDSDAADRKKRE